MATEKKEMEPSDFYSAAEGRLDRWRTLHRIAKNLVGAAERDAETPRQEAQKLLADMGPDRRFLRLPRARLMAQLHERLQTSDWTGFARLVQRISSGLMTNSYRDNTEAWKAEEETEVRPTTSCRVDRPRAKPEALFRGTDGLTGRAFDVAGDSGGLPATAPRRGPVRLRTGRCRQLRGRCPRNGVQLQPAGSRD